MRRSLSQATTTIYHSRATESFKIKLTTILIKLRLKLYCKSYCDMILCLHCAAIKQPDRGQTDTVGQTACSSSSSCLRACEVGPGRKGCDHKELLPPSSHLCLDPSLPAHSCPTALHPLPQLIVLTFTWKQNETSLMQDSQAYTAKCYQPIGCYEFF